MARSTQQIRDAYQPACDARERNGVVTAWRAFDACLQWARYEARPGDTAFRNCRRITGGTGYSLHAYFIAGAYAFWNWLRDHLGHKLDIGVALDLNWKSNPYGARLVTDMPRPMVEAILAIRTVDGIQVFRWGGYYTGNKDAMHYELVAFPAELARGIDWSTVVAGPAQAPGTYPSPPPEDHDQEDDMQPILGVQKSNGAGYVLLLPNVGPHPVVKVPLADFDAKGGAGGVDDALRDKLMVYVQADDALVDRIPDAG